MLVKYLSGAAILALAQLAAAQTHTDCNPMEKACKSDPAVGTTVDVDFTKGKNPLFYEFTGTKIDYTDKGAIFTINSETDAPTIGSTKYIFFGKVDVTVIAAPGTGVVTSFVLQSDNLDEIDWEWIGGDNAQVQTNYFGKGDTTTYDRGKYHPVSNPQSTVHTYSIDWTKDYVRWYIDGTMVRELKYADAKAGTRFPQTPMQIRLGTWVAGRKNAPTGTVQWAGGYTDFSKAPFIAYYQDIKITDYSNGVSGATSYSFKPAPNGGAYTDIIVSTDPNAANSTTSEPSSSQSSGSASSTGSATGSATSGASSITTATKSGSASSTPTTTGINNAIVSATPTRTAAPTGAASVKSFSPIALGAALLAAVVF